VQMDGEPVVEDKPPQVVLDAWSSSVLIRGIDVRVNFSLMFVRTDAPRTFLSSKMISGSSS
jgi:hypothetical protein